MTHADALQRPLAHGLEPSDCAEELVQLGSYPDMRLINGVATLTRILVLRCRACQMNIVMLEDGRVLNAYRFEDRDDRDEQDAQARR